MATLAVTFGGAKLAMGGDKKEKTNIPPINAKSSDEEKFVKFVYQPALPSSRPLRQDAGTFGVGQELTHIRDFLANIEAEEKKAKAAH